MSRLTSVAGNYTSHWSPVVYLHVWVSSVLKMYIYVTLQDSLTLEKLNLSGNCVTGVGALHMARMLIDNDYISELVCLVNCLYLRFSYFIII